MLSPDAEPAQESFALITVFTGSGVDEDGEFVEEIGEGAGMVFEELEKLFSGFLPVSVIVLHGNAITGDRNGVDLFN